MANDFSKITIDGKTYNVKLPNQLKVGSKTFDGSSEVTIAATDLGLSNALKFIGETTETPLVDGSTTSSVKIGSTTHTAATGDVVLYGAKEFVWQGSVWRELGDGSSHALKTISITGANGLTGGGTLEANRTISHADTSSQASISASGRRYITGVTLDDYGHVTGLTTGTETVTAPTVNNGKLTIQKNGANVGEFTANQSGNTTANITVPTKVSELTNDSGFKTTDNNTTYSLSKSGSTITLTGSDGSTTSVTDANTTYSVPVNATTSAVSPSACTSNGFYYVNSTTNSLTDKDGNPFLQYHSTQADFRILTTAYSSDWLQQIATDFRSEHIYIRRCENGTWKPWEEIAKTSEIPTDYLKPSTVTAGVTSTSTLSAGNNATATATWDSTNKKINFTFGIPKGANGSNGTNGAQGYSVVATVDRQNFTEAQWSTYGTVGHLENWGNTSNSGVRVGDIFFVAGTSTDAGKGHLLVYQYQTYSGSTLYGKCLGHHIISARGATGAAAGFGTPTATVDANVGTPSVTVTASGSNTAKVFNFAFKNLKGEKGDKGDAGVNATTTAEATTSVSGLMSAADKTKLESLKSITALDVWYDETSGVRADSNGISWHDGFALLDSGDSTVIGGTYTAKVPIVAGTGISITSSDYEAAINWGLGDRIAAGTGTLAVTNGNGNTASGNYSMAVNNTNTASGLNSFAAGLSNTAQAFQAVFGKYGTSSGGPGLATTSGDIFKIGNGTSNLARSNAMRVDATGKVYGKSTFGSSGADYAEMWEWADGNHNNEDRRGKFVTVDENDKIRIATTEDEYILGIISAMPSIVGDVQSETWHEMYLKDVFGENLVETVEVEETKDENTGEVIPAHTEKRWILNPEYDPTRPYVSRDERKEWAAVGLMGKLIVNDDGTCKAGQYCKLSGNGDVTASTDKNDYRVLKRLDGTHVQILYR